MEKKSSLFLGIIIIIGIIICGIWMYQKTDKINTGEELQVLIVGDSIGEGAGASDPSLKWYKYLISYMKDKYGKELHITNVSMGGNTSYAGFVRVMQLKENEDYDLVMVCFGENDIEEDFSEHYEQLLQTILSKWPSCKLITILESSQREYTPKMQSVQRLSEQYHAYIMDTIAAFDRSGMKYEELCEDGTHPNDEGQKIYYKEASKVIDQIYGQVLEDNLKLQYYSMKEFKQTDSYSLELNAEGEICSIGIDYERIPGYHEIEVFVDGSSIWKYQDNWKPDYSQRHIEEIERGEQYITNIIITFSSKEQMEGFHGIILQ
mgnify:FL=1